MGDAKVGARTPQVRSDTTQASRVRRYRVHLYCAQSVEVLVDEIARNLGGLGFDVTVMCGAQARSSLLQSASESTEPTIHVVCVQGAIQEGLLRPLHEALAGQRVHDQHLLVAVLDLALPLAMVGQVRRFAETLERRAPPEGPLQERRRWREHMGGEDLESMKTRPVKTIAPVVEVHEADDESVAQGEVFVDDAPEAPVSRDSKRIRVGVPDAIETTGPDSTREATVKIKLPPDLDLGPSTDRADPAATEPDPPPAPDLPDDLDLGPPQGATVAVRPPPPPASAGVPEEFLPREFEKKHTLSTPPVPLDVALPMSPLIDPTAPSTQDEELDEGPPLSSDSDNDLAAGSAVALYRGPKLREPKPARAGSRTLVGLVVVVGAAVAATIGYGGGGDEPRSAASRDKPEEAEANRQAPGQAPAVAPPPPTRLSRLPPPPPPPPAEELIEMPLDEEAAMARLEQAVERRTVAAVTRLFVSKPVGGDTQWRGAMRQCNKFEFEGVTGWRLPTRRELSLLRAVSLLPSGAFWSRTEAEDDPDAAYVYDTTLGRLVVYLKDEPTASPICVRPRPRS